MEKFYYRLFFLSISYISVFKIFKKESKKEEEKLYCEDILDYQKMKNRNRKDIENFFKNQYSNSLKPAFDLEANNVDDYNFCDNFKIDFDEECDKENEKEHNKCYDKINKSNIDNYLKKIKMKNKEDKELGKQTQEIEEIRNKTSDLNQKISDLGCKIDLLEDKKILFENFISLIRKKITEINVSKNKGKHTEDQYDFIEKNLYNEIDIFRKKIRNFEKEEKALSYDLENAFQEKMPMNILGSKEKEIKDSYDKYKKELNLTVCKVLKSGSYIYARDLRNESGEKIYKSSKDQKLMEEAKKFFDWLCKKIFGQPKD